MKMRTKWENKSFQKKTYENLYSDLEFALYKINNPFRGYFENKVVSLTLRNISSAKMCCLDVGCGHGVTTYILSKHFKSVIGVDFSENAIQTAKKLLKKMKVKNAKVFVADLDNLSLKENCVDVIFIKDVLHHIDNVKELLERLKKFTKSGLIIGAENNGASPLMQLSGRLLKHERGVLKLNEEWLRNIILSAGFEKVNIWSFSYFPYSFRIPIITYPKLRFLLPIIIKIEDFLVKTMFCKFANYLIYQASFCQPSDF